MLIDRKSKASPPIEQSVIMTGTDTYRMGSEVVCKRATSQAPDNALAAWKEDGGYYYLARNTRSNAPPGADAAGGMIYQAGTSSAVWEIGNNAICKVIYSWIDVELSRTFLVLRRVQGGQTLERAWPSLNSEKRAHVAASIARYCLDLADETSDYLQSSTGCGVLEPFLNVDGKESHPSWKPRPLGPLSWCVAERYFQKISTVPMPGLGRCFHFYHADLNPTNILVADDGTTVSILDWESAGFYPRFWIPLKPWRSGGFNLDAPAGFQVLDKRSPMETK
ncbi:hypothetical protein BJY01DRAFT_241505 [Aspergillus pseudoustus]|uniref:Aminoglycoside phosphotransferase domain-containing protein n=1 Tax=Aspergillus pseudoustus TaxID=1810923 RepID=A0ABR4ID74_9EURO